MFRLLFAFVLAATLFSTANVSLAQLDSQFEPDELRRLLQDDDAPRPGAQEDSSADAPAAPPAGDANTPAPPDAPGDPALPANPADIEPPAAEDPDMANPSTDPRRSGYQPPPNQPLPPISGQPPVASSPGGPVYKMVFSGCYGTFHLIDQLGTAHYTLGGKKHLALLRYQKADLKYTHYVVEIGDPFASKWAFSRLPDAPGQYSVWRLTRNGWKLYDMAHVSRPR